MSVARAALPWAWAALVTLLAFYGTRAYVEKKAASEPEATPAPHIIKL